MDAQGPSSDPAGHEEYNRLALGLRRALTLGRVRDQLLSMSRLGEMAARMQDEWVGLLRGAELPVHRLSIALPAPDPSRFRLFWSVFGRTTTVPAGDYPWAVGPWVARAWKSGFPVTVDYRELLGAGFPYPEVRTIVEVPFADRPGSLGVSSLAEDAFDSDAVSALVDFAAAVAHGLARIEELEAGAQREAEHRLLLDNSQDVIYQLDADGVIRYVSPVVTPLLGYAVTEVVGARFEAFVHADDQPGCRRVLLRAVENGQRQDGFEYRLYHRDGTWRWQASNVGPCRDASGRITGVQGVSWDITERRRSETALRLYKAALDASNVGHAIAGLDGRLLYVNPNLAAAYGYQPDELVGEPFSELFLGQAEATQLWDQLVASGGVTVHESWHRRRDGTPLPVLMTGAWVRDAAGLAQGLALTTFDLTEHQARERATQSEHLRIVADSRLRALREMATGVAHELNQPLTGIRALAEAAVFGLDHQWATTADETRSTCTEVIRLADRMAATIRHMRDLADDPGAQGEGAACRPAAAVAGVLEFAAARLVHSGVRVETEVAPDLPWVAAAQSQVEQVLLHLLTNAGAALAERARGAATPDWHPRLTIGASRVPGCDAVCFHVDDNGGGIETTVLPRIFDPFFTTRQVGQGAGLGLSIARAAAERHGGILEADNRAGDGVTFRLRLPVVGAPPRPD